MDARSDDMGRLERLLKGNCGEAVVIPHVSPDGDAMGASLALSLALDKLKVTNHVIVPDTVADYLKFMVHPGRTLLFREATEESVALMERASIIFMVDHNDVEREGELQQYNEASSAVKVLIDHHPGHRFDGADITISEPTAPATCTILFKIFKELYGMEFIDAEIADALYAGIITDTGNFDHSVSSPELYRIVADLMECGVHRDYVYGKIFRSARLREVRLRGYVQLRCTRIDASYPIAIIAISRYELERFDYQEGDLEGVVNIPLTIEGVKVSVMITERYDKVKISMRSVGEIPVNEWCERSFNGGGHKNAAGGRVERPFREVVKRVWGEIPDFFSRLGIEPTPQPLIEAKPKPRHQIKPQVEAKPKPQTKAKK